MGKDKNDQDATEDTWTFDGRAFQKKNEKMKTLLESKGGPNLVRHYTGEYSCDIIQAKIFELAPIQDWETEAGWGEDGANWEEGDVPHAWMEFCRDYTLGRRNIAEPLKFRHIPIEACQRAFILTLAKDRDEEVYSIVQTKCRGLALSGLASIPKAKGNLIMPHFLDHWGKPDIAEVNDMMRALAACDPKRTGEKLDDDTDLRRWFIQLEEYREECADISQCPEAAKDRHSSKYPDLNLDKMCESVRTAFKDCTEVYDNTLETFGDVSTDYKALKEKLLAKWRALQRRKSSKEQAKKSFKQERKPVFTITEKPGAEACHACGKEGHWKGDPICEKYAVTVAGKGKGWQKGGKGGKG